MSIPHPFKPQSFSRNDVTLCYIHHLSVVLLVQKLIVSKLEITSLSWSYSKLLSNNKSGRASKLCRFACSDSNHRMFLASPAVWKWADWLNGSHAKSLIIEKITTMLRWNYFNIYLKYNKFLFITFGDLNKFQWQSKCSLIMNELWIIFQAHNNYCNYLECT